MMKKDVPVYDAGIFTWRGNLGCADASDLGIASMHSISRQIWDDSCDIGFFLWSPKTHRKVLFVFEHTDCLDDGDIISTVWTAYDPADHGVIPCGRGRGEPLKVTIFND